MRRPKPVEGLKKFVSHRRPAITEVLREPTSGGVVFRRSEAGKTEILLIQDAKGRWTIPKGHIEPGESSRQTAEREVGEETGLKELKVYGFLGKIHFRYRRGESLVLMTTDIYLIQATGGFDQLKAESWMSGIQWFPASEALDKIEYEDIEKLMLVGLKKIRENKL